MQTLINYFARKFQSFGFAGALRFKILFLIYKLVPCIGSRGEELSFVLGYLPQVKKSQKEVFVLDVGASSSLLVYELCARGYKTFAIDLRDYQERLPRQISFFRGDITKLPFKDNVFDYATSISVIEHIGIGEYKDELSVNGDEKAIAEIARVLKSGGQLLLTVPNKIFSKTFTFRGYNYPAIKKLTEKSFFIQEFTERQQQVCTVLVKK